MRSVIRIIFISLTITTLISCDLLEDLMTKNHFAEVADSSSISLNVTDFQNLQEGDKPRVVDKYTGMVFDPVESKKLYEALRDNEETIDAFTALIDEQIVILKTEVDSIATDIGELDPLAENYQKEFNDLLNQYKSTNNKYQKLNVALAKIHIYPRDLADSSVIAGTQLALVGYESGIITDQLDTSIIREYLLDINIDTSSTEFDEKRIELKTLLDGIDNGAEGLKKLGASIIDRDFPSTPYINENDAAFVLLAMVLDKVIEETYVSLGESITKDQIITDITDDLVDNPTTYTSYIIYPDKMTGSVFSERYLGEYGALVFAATNYTLPDAVLLEGGK